MCTSYFLKYVVFIVFMYLSMHAYRTNVWGSLKIRKRGAPGRHSENVVSHCSIRRCTCTCTCIYGYLPTYSPGGAYTYNNTIMARRVCAPPPEKTKVDRWLISHADSAKSHYYYTRLQWYVTGRVVRVRALS